MPSEPELYVPSRRKYRCKHLCPVTVCFYWHSRHERSIKGSDGPCAKGRQLMLICEDIISASMANVQLINTKEQCWEIRCYARMVSILQSSGTTYPYKLHASLSVDPSKSSFEGSQIAYISKTFACLEWNLAIYLFAAFISHLSWNCQRWSMKTTIQTVFRGWKRMRGPIWAPQKCSVGDHGTCIDCKHAGQILR